MLPGLGACRASLVSLEEPVQCIHVWPTCNIDSHAVLPDTGYLPEY